MSDSDEKEEVKVSEKKKLSNESDSKKSSLYHKMKAMVADLCDSSSNSAKMPI